MKFCSALAPLWFLAALRALASLWFFAALRALAPLWFLATQCILAWVLASCWIALSACTGGSQQGPEHDAGPEPVFGEDVEAWTEGRTCGFTHEHDLRYIRVMVDEAADVPYQALEQNYPYPVGATLVKLEYDDEDCTELVGFTAMKKRAAGYSALGNDWQWQRLDAERNVLEDGEIRTCITCHQHHCTWPICGYEDCGFDLTCGQELP